MTTRLAAVTRSLRMTRPGFLVVTGVGCALGLASAAQAGVVSPVLALATLVLALGAHAAANTLNDHEDARNGADEANADGVFPFTGGSRLIQQGVVSLGEMRRLTLLLGTLVVCGGLLLAARVGPVVVGLGLAGVLLGWAYSAPPLALMSRGLGEAAVAMAWWLVVVGTDAVQRGHLGAPAAQAGVSFGLLVAAILLANGFPDARADASVGKCTLVVRLTPPRAADAYLALVLAAHAWLAAGLWRGWFPPAAAIALVSLPLSLAASAILRRHAMSPARLKPALILTILAAVVHGLLFSAGLWLAAR